jgi:hypothetical protein
LYYARLQAHNEAVVVEMNTLETSVLERIRVHFNMRKEERER